MSFYKSGFHFHFYCIVFETYFWFLKKPAAVTLERVSEETPDYFSMCVVKYMDIEHVSNVLACDNYYKGKRDIQKDVFTFLLPSAYSFFSNVSQSL